MDVKAVNSISLQQSFEGKKSKRKENNNGDYQQINSPASKKAASALRNTAMGLLLLGSAAGMSTGMTSCVKAEAWAEAEANAWAWGWIINNGDCNCKPDTIFQTTPIKDVNWAVNDSIKNQFINIGSEVDGPIDGENVLLVSGTLHNRYDNKIIDFQVDSVGCNSRQMMYVSKVTDLYDEQNPKKEWWQVTAMDVPGKGIKYSFATTNSKEKPEPWQYDQKYSIIVSNGARGNKPGINTIYDKDGNMIWKGQLEKGQQAGAFTYGVLALDENGEVYIDPDTGKPEMIDYDFDNTKIWTREVEWGKFKQPAKTEDVDYDLWH